MTEPRYEASIVIPAHNEERALPVLLSHLTGGADGGKFDIVVVCNGCTDRTALIARTFSPAVRVIEISEPSKYTALRVGDERSFCFPRVYIDADVQLRAADVLALTERLAVGDVLACAPERHINRAHVQRAAQRYYDVWERLPQVRTGLFGRGVIAVSRDGHTRIRNLPHVMSDDLAMSEAFAPNERCIVARSRVVVYPARNLRDLVRRRVRVATGNSEATQLQLRGNDSRTTISTLLGLAATDSSVLTGLPVFLAVTVIARRKSRAQIRTGRPIGWERDESSRVADR